MDLLNIALLSSGISTFGRIAAGLEHNKSPR
jgi:hypothetical protein